MKAHSHTLQIQEAADLLGLSMGSVYKAARANALPFPCVRIGQRFVIPIGPFEEATGIKVVREEVAA
jgi:excisionase family DNA binding protein